MNIEQVARTLYAGYITWRQHYDFKKAHEREILLFEESEEFDGVRPYKRKFKYNEITAEEYNKIYNEALQRWKNKAKNDKSDNNGE